MTGSLAARSRSRRASARSVVVHRCAAMENRSRRRSASRLTSRASAVEAGASLWRLSVPATAAPLKLSGEQLLEWGGAQRWICTSTPSTVLREVAQAAGGHAVLFRSAEKSAGAFAPLAPPLDRIQRDLQRAFDPDGVFNPVRLAAGA